MLKKIISASLTLALLVSINLPVKASEISKNSNSNTISQSIEFMKNVQDKEFHKSTADSKNVSAIVNSLPSQPFYVAEYSDALNSNIYSRNQTGTISQDYFPLVAETYQKGKGTINEVKVDGTDITQVYNEDDFYNIGENKAVFFVVEQDPTDSSNSSWYTYMAVSTLSKGIHTIQVYCTVNGTRLSDLIRINVV